MIIEPNQIAAMIYLIPDAIFVQRVPYIQNKKYYVNLLHAIKQH